LAQTWPVTRSKRITFAALDAVGGAIARLGRALSPRHAIPPGDIRRILVVEPWHIGDVVLATPLLRALRSRYPRAHISLLGKRHAEELLMHSGLVDEVIVFDFPWTATEKKYQLRRYDRQSFRALVARLRSGRFDLTIDSRMDIRSNLVTYLSGAPKRIGYRFGGGSFLLTDALPADPDAHHKVDDWLALLGPLDEAEAAASNFRRDTETAALKPLLRLSDAERELAREKFRSHGVDPGDLIIGVHPGASHPRRRWPLARFAAVAESLRSNYAARIVVFVDPSGWGADMPVHDGAFIRSSLRELMAAVAECDLLLCNDSGPMHIADALGIPVVAVFTTGNPVWYRPWGEHQLVVGRGTGHKSIGEPKVAEVQAAAEAQLARVLENRRDAAAYGGIDF